MRLAQITKNGFVVVFVPFFLVAAILITIGSCTKSGNEITSAYVAAPHDSTDVKTIQAFIAAHDPKVSKKLSDTIFHDFKRSTTSTLYYRVVNDSTHNHFPTVDSGVVFNYSLRMLSDPHLKIIDSVGIPGYTVSPLSETLGAITEGLQYIHRGGRILLLVPSSLGFRDNPTNVTYNLITGGQITTTVPKNSPLILDITLVRLSRNF